MFYETRGYNPNKSFQVLSFVIYTIIHHYVFIDYLGFQSKQLSEIPVGSGGVYKHGKTIYEKYWEL